MPTIRLLVLGILPVIQGIAAGAVIQPAGSTSLGVQAEDYDALTGTRWQVVDTTSSLTSPAPTSVPILPASSNALGGEALLAGFSGSNSTASYHLVFNTPGTYYVYLHLTTFDSGAEPANFYNEDSIFISTALTATSTTDIFDFDIKNAAPGSGYWEGNFHWQQVKLRNASSFLAYNIQPADLGKALTLQIANRENGATIDYILLSTKSGLTETELYQMVPEPTTSAILLTGGLGFFGVGLRKAKHSLYRIQHLARRGEHMGRK